MKRSVIYGVFVLVLCTSCQNRAFIPQFSTLELEFPWAFTAQPELFDQFLQKTDKIEVRLYQNGHEVWSGWSRLESLDEFVIPAEVLEKGSTVLEIDLWDHLENGEPRDRPSVGGSLSLSEVEKGQVLRIPLALKIPIEELGN